MQQFLQRENLCNSNWRTARWPIKYWLELRNRLFCYLGMVLCSVTLQMVCQYCTVAIPSSIRSGERNIRNIHANYTKFTVDAIYCIIRGAPALGTWLICIARIMVQLSRNISLRKLWHHFIEISFSRVQLQDALNRYWASAMTNNGVSQSPPASTQRITFDGKMAKQTFLFTPWSFFVLPESDQSDSLSRIPLVVWNRVRVGW